MDTWPDLAASSAVPSPGPGPGPAPAAADDVNDAANARVRPPARVLRVVRDQPADPTPDAASELNASSPAVSDPPRAELPGDGVEPPGDEAEPAGDDAGSAADGAGDYPEPGLAERGRGRTCGCGQVIPLPAGSSADRRPGGYQSKHRLTGPPKEGRPSDSYQRKPRHAAPPVSFGVALRSAVRRGLGMIGRTAAGGAALGRRLASVRLTSRSAAHAGW